MDNTNYIALSRQMALWKQMDTIANNMANVNTAGFKQDDTLFTSYLVKTPEARGIGRVPLFFTEDFGTMQNFAEGAIVDTGNALDAAINGDAFFAVETKAGEMYTRKGQFALDADGKIVTNDGAVLLSENNEPLFIAPGEREISISENGDVMTENGVIGRLKLVHFADNQKLLKVAGVMFQNVAGNKAEAATNVRVIQGSVEKSNVNAIEEMTRLINVQRSYEYVQQMIDEEHDRLSNTISTFAELA